MRINNELERKVMRIFRLKKTAATNVSYTGIVLQDSVMENGKIIPSRTLLKKFSIPQGWTPLANHMTINLGSAKEISKQLLDQQVSLNVVAVAKDNNVMAAKVETNLSTTSTIHHITLATNPQNPEATPSMSNDLQNWQPIAPFSISGIVKEVKTDGFILTDEERQKAEVEQQRLIEERKRREKEKSDNSPTNIIQSRGLSREQAIEFLKTETKIPEQAWENILRSAGL